MAQSVNQTQDTLLTLSTFIISPIGLIVATFVCVTLLRTLCIIPNNKYYRYALLSAASSSFGSTAYFFITIFLSNDAVFPVASNFDNKAFTDFIDVSFIATFIFGKVAYYMTFSSHIQSILYLHKYKAPSRFLNIWTFLISFALLVCGLYMIIDFVSNPSENAYGTSPKTKISYLFPADSANKGSDLVALCAFCIGIIYYVVLAVYYSKTVKSMEITTNIDTKHKCVRGLVLLIVSSLFFYFTLVIAVPTDTFTFVALQGIDLISDDICLWLTFDEQAKIYAVFCGLCNKCCIRCLFSNASHKASDKGQSIAM